MFDQKEATERLAIYHEKGKQLWRDLTAAAQAMEWELNANRSKQERQEQFPPPRLNLMGLRRKCIRRRNTSLKY